MLYQFEIKTALPDAESLRRLETRLQLDPQDKWTRLYGVQHGQARENRYEFNIVDRFLGQIGVKVTGSVEGGTVMGQFRPLILELLFFLIAFGLCILFGGSALKNGQFIRFLNVMIVFFFIAFVYMYRTLRFRDLIIHSLERILDVK